MKPHGTRTIVILRTPPLRSVTSTASLPLLSLSLSLTVPLSNREAYVVRVPEHSTGRMAYDASSSPSLDPQLSIPSSLSFYVRITEGIETASHWSKVKAVIKNIITFSINMSYTNASSGSGSRGARRTVEFGRTYVVRPKGKHQATVVWLHGLGDNGSSWSQLLDNLPLPNIKWICPTAPTRPVTVLGGFPCTAWFDEGELSDDGPKDVEGLDTSASHIANLLSTEPSDVKLGIGGFSMGAACALYSATCFVHGRYGNGSPYLVNLKAVVGLSGWLPGGQNLRNMMLGSHDAIRRAASLPVLLCHGVGDEVVPYKFGEKSSQILSSVGFRYVTFKTYQGLGHYTIPKEMEEVCQWLNERLGV